MQIMELLNLIGRWDYSSCGMGFPNAALRCSSIVVAGHAACQDGAEVSLLKLGCHAGVAFFAAAVLGLCAVMGMKACKCGRQEQGENLSTLSFCRAHLGLHDTTHTHAVSQRRATLDPCGASCAWDMSGRAQNMDGAWALCGKAHSIGWPPLVVGRREGHSALTTPCLMPASPAQGQRLVSHRQLAHPGSRPGRATARVLLCRCSTPCWCRTPTCSCCARWSCPRRRRPANVQG